ncbi:copper transporting ATPase Ccc2 [Schizosaccharomyces japonicus yFS275]|uniref:P-type Cu(+) transporter n=1 Tax=Schizosaccharomyces japonicus (strain yFS275 / FY16936) TaxID=402676 RepID=B6K2D1_SCHJY|nr:copper transporting ATPase Ccc2 [Schizosaccharomyces japonicus yFS275]EEB07312.1 copper transporting ATPase Ccc2 [Schizosaccharomyces japonicus yFS275]
MSQDNVTTTVLSVKGMTCASCVASIQNALQPLPGMKNFTVTLMLERAVALHDSATLSAEEIKEHIEDCGFDAEISHSSCGEHVNVAHYTIESDLGDVDWSKIQRELLSLEGVLAARKVLLGSSNSEIQVAFDEESIGPRRILYTLYGCQVPCVYKPVDNVTAQVLSLKRINAQRIWGFRFWFALFFSLLVMSVDELPHIFNYFHEFFEMPSVYGFYLSDVLAFLLSVPVQLCVGRAYFVTAYRSIRHGGANMDVLVSIGSLTAFFASIFFLVYYRVLSLEERAPVFFDTSNMLLTFVTLGRFLENKAKGATSTALSHLLNLVPSSVTLLRGGEQTDICVDLIERNDKLLIKPGDKIPADGFITEGHSYIDESSVTGEPTPVFKSEGSTVLSGTTNGNGRLIMQATKVPRESHLALVVKLVREAQSNQVPIQRFVDKVSAIFVPAILLLALSTFIFWFCLTEFTNYKPPLFQSSAGNFAVCLNITMSVIVVACPCAFGLSTPTAVMVGTGVAALNGILFKGGDVLERLESVDAVVLDKTGTLTKGSLSVSDYAFDAEALAASGLSDESSVWRAVKTIERASEHPTAKAMLTKANEIDSLNVYSMDNFSAIPGYGVGADIIFDEKETRVMIGNYSLMESSHAVMSEAIQHHYSDYSSKGKTCIFVSAKRWVVAVVACSDEIRPNARQTVSEFLNLHKNVYMLTGDQPETAEFVANEVGIPKSNVRAGVSPAGKAEFIEALRKENHIVAMVGDGINDSPSLTLADVGISFSTASGLAAESADVLLTRVGSIIDTVVAFSLARSIFRRIRLNLLWACAYNFVMLPVAMGVLLPWGIYLPPMFASTAMMFSSLSVICSSLMLKRWKRPSRFNDFQEEATSDYETEQTPSDFLSFPRRHLRRLFGISSGQQSYMAVPNVV